MMFIILNNKNRALDVKAHEEMLYEEVKTYHNPTLNKWAVEVSGKFDHRLPTVDELGEGWICEN